MSLPVYWKQYRYDETRYGSTFVHKCAERKKSLRFGTYVLDLQWQYIDANDFHTSNGLSNAVSCQLGNVQKPHDNSFWLLISTIHPVMRMYLLLGDLDHPFYRCWGKKRRHHLVCFKIERFMFKRIWDIRIHNHILFQCISSSHNCENELHFWMVLSPLQMPQIDAFEIFSWMSKEVLKPFPV